MGDRGLSYGEEGLQREVTKKVEEKAPPVTVNEDETPCGLALSTTEGVPVPQDGFEKELMGLTGGFPGAEKGLKLFIQKKPTTRKAIVCRLRFRKCYTVFRFSFLTAKR